VRLCRRDKKGTQNRQSYSEQGLSLIEKSFETYARGRSKQKGRLEQPCICDAKVLILQGPHIRGDIRLIYMRSNNSGHISAQIEQITSDGLSHVQARLVSCPPQARGQYLPFLGRE
jgi:hypothetical protein